MAPTLLTQAPESTRPIPPGELCARIERRLSERVGDSRFDRYFRNAARLVIDEGRLTVDVPSAFYASWLEGNFDEPLRSSACEVCGDPDLDVRWRVSPEAFSSVPAFQAPGAPESSAPGRARGPAPKRASRRRSDRAHHRARAARQTLESFVVGESNRLAFSAARQFVQPEESSGFRTLFIHGECGVGKTHLLQGIVDAELRECPSSRVRYTTAEAFTNEYIHAVRAREIDRFRASYRKLDLLCIDDVGFIAGKRGTQSEFLHTFDTLDLAMSRVALASDAHPTEIATLSRRLVSRCVAGMVVRIDWPDAQTRSEIARRRAAARGLHLTAQGLEELCASTSGSVRDLEGLLARLEALVRLLPDAGPGDGPIPLALVRKAIEPARAVRLSKPIRIETIIDVVLDELRVEMDDLRGRGRHGRVVLARSLIAHLARKLTAHSFPEIARAIGRPNHSTVVTACQRIDRRLSQADSCAEIPEESEISLNDLCGRLTRRIVERSRAVRA